MPVRLGRIVFRAPAPRRCVPAVVALLVAAGVWMLREPVGAVLRTHPYFSVSDPVVRGTGPLLTRREVLAWLGVGGAASIWEMSPARVRARLETHPLIARARVRREFPNMLEIDVRVRRPRAIVVLDRLYYLGRDGHLLLPLRAEHAADYPVITGLTPETPVGYRTWALRSALRLVRLCGRIGWRGGVSEIHVDAERGMVLYPRRERVRLLLGRGSWHEKLLRAGRVLDAWSGRTRHLAEIDLRFRNQVVVRLRGETSAPPRERKQEGRARA